jgi:hypothetical protein
MSKPRAQVRLNRTQQAVLPIAVNQYATALRRAHDREEIDPNFYFLCLSSEELKQLHKALQNNDDEVLRPIRELLGQWRVGKALELSEAAA